MSLTATLRDLNKLNTFVRVAERKSFTKAAADLRTTPSVVSKRMKELEEALGFTLMNRSTHGVVLTDAGEGLFRTCLEMLARVDEYVVDARNLQTGPYGTLRVMTTSDLAPAIVSPLVIRFADERPGLRVHLFVLEESSTPVEDGFDVIVAGKRSPPPGFGVHDLGAIEHVVCAAPRYLESHGRPSAPHDLREHNCLANIYSGLKEWPFRVGSRAVQIEVKGALSSNSHAALVQMAVEGHGIIRVPRHAVKRELEAGQLEAILDSMSPERLSLYAPKAKHLPTKTTEFIQYLRDALNYH